MGVMLGKIPVPLLFVIFFINRKGILYAETSKPDLDLQGNLESETAYCPATRYRHLLRQIKIRIIDRRYDSINPLYVMVPEKFLEGLQLLMQPFVDHIRPVFEPARDKIHVHVGIYSVQHMQKVQIKGSHLNRKKHPGVPHPRDLDEAYFPIYSELLEIAWPWTRVPWRYTLQTPVDQKIQGIRNEIFQSCTVYANKNGPLVLEGLRLKPYQSWIIMGGRRILKDRSDTYDKYWKW